MAARWNRCSSVCGCSGSSPDPPRSRRTASPDSFCSRERRPGDGARLPVHARQDPRPLGLPIPAAVSLAVLATAGAALAAPA
ncbi:MAG: hypothetical protein EOP25_06220 [Rhodococcus sp. (in: high G+C Gram-positive bacteria)]|nr:MAG: hypothetical protein EOP25_06220 [Rhodococcus sp. (in: high G+C Gram-positive bacteria)]